jgi:hypothetical protein
MRRGYLGSLWLQVGCMGHKTRRMSLLISLLEVDEHRERGRVLTHWKVQIIPNATSGKHLP